MERLKSHDPNTIRSLIESRIRVEKYADKNQVKQQANGTLYKRLQEYPELQTKSNNKEACIIVLKSNVTQFLILILILILFLN